MKRNLLLIAIMILGALTVSAKKVKVTIDGRTSPSQTKLYLIINEDTANAVRVPINDAQFSITVKVDRNAFIRLHDWKQWPERSVFVLIPDSKHITIDWNSGSIEGSPMSKKLQSAMHDARMNDPGSFHIDVFSDNPEAWQEARIRERSIRESMENRQREDIMQVIRDNSDSNIAAWVYFCLRPKLIVPIEYITNGTHPKWMDHPILKIKQ